MRVNLNPLRRKRAGVAAIAVTAMLALAACGGGGGSSDVPTDGDSTSTAEDTTLRISVANQPAGFDVINRVSNTDAFIWSSLYDMLVVQGDDGRPMPNAAESWDISEDGTTITLHLRDDMVFANGDKVTAEHAKATLDHIKANPGPTQHTMASVTSIEAPDDHTLVVSFDEPDINWMFQLIIANGLIGHKDHLEDADAATNPMGSGPYTIDMSRSVPGSNWTLVRNDDHWNAAAYPFKTVTVTVIADATAAENAMRSGQLDWLLAPNPATTQSFADAGFTITQVDGMAMNALRIFDRDGTIVPALGDVRVRQAINYALDRDAFVEAIALGDGSPTSQLFFPGTAANDPSLDTRYAFDVDRAKELMAEAGYADGFDVTMPSILWTQQFDPLITQALADIGIRVTWEPIPAQETINAVLSGRFPMIVFPTGAENSTQIVVSNYEADSFNNPLGTTDPELDALLAEFRTTMDEAERDEIIRDINAFIVENAWDAPIMLSNVNHILAPGFEFRGTPMKNFSSLTFFGLAD